MCGSSHAQTLFVHKASVIQVWVGVSATQSLPLSGKMSLVTGKMEDTDLISEAFRSEICCHTRPVSTYIECWAKNFPQIGCRFLQQVMLQSLQEHRFLRHLSVWCFVIPFIFWIIWKRLLLRNNCIRICLPSIESSDALVIQMAEECECC